MSEREEQEEFDEDTAATQQDSKNTSSFDDNAKENDHNDGGGSSSRVSSQHEEGYTLVRKEHITNLPGFAAEVPPFTAAESRRISSTTSTSNITDTTSSTITGSTTSTSSTTHQGHASIPPPALAQKVTEQNEGESSSRVSSQHEGYAQEVRKGHMMIRSSPPPGLATVGAVSRPRSRTSNIGIATSTSTQSASMPPAAFHLLENSLYRDFSHVPPSKSYNPPSPTTQDATFPEKLHFILSDSTYVDCVCWLPHGRAWRLLKPSDFEERVLKLFFNHSNLSSFKRQVNGWCFKRITHGIDEGAYYHELFLCGMPHLCQSMSRGTTINKYKNIPPSSSNLTRTTRRTSSMTTIHPNFYEFSTLYTLMKSTNEEHTEMAPNNDARNAVSSTVDSSAQVNATSKKSAANASSTSENMDETVLLSGTKSSTDLQQLMQQLQQDNNEGFQGQSYLELLRSQSQGQAIPQEVQQQAQFQQQQDQPQLLSQDTNHHHEWHQPLQNQQRNLQLEENNRLHNSQPHQQYSPSQTPSTIISTLLQQQQEYDYQRSLLAAMTANLISSNLQILQNHQLQQYLQQGHLPQNDQLQQIVTRLLQSQGSPLPAQHQNNQLQQIVTGLLQQPHLSAQQPNHQLQQIVTGLLQQPPPPLASQQRAPQLQQLVTGLLQHQQPLPALNSLVPSNQIQQVLAGILQQPPLPPPLPRESRAQYGVQDGTQQNSELSTMAVNTNTRKRKNYQTGNDSDSNDDS